MKNSVLTSKVKPKTSKISIDLSKKIKQIANIEFKKIDALLLTRKYIFGVQISVLNRIEKKDL